MDYRGFTIERHWRTREGARRPDEYRFDRVGEKGAPSRHAGFGATHEECKRQIDDVLFDSTITLAIGMAQEDEVLADFLGNACAIARGEAGYEEQTVCPRVAAGLLRDVEMEHNARGHLKELLEGIFGVWEAVIIDRRFADAFCRSSRESGG